MLGLLLGVVLAPAARAQDVDPLADEEAWKAGVTRELLDEAGDARTQCNKLVDDVNELARHWEAVRVGTMDRDTLAGVLGDSERQWVGHRGGCDVAITRLPAGAITESVITRQREQLVTVWKTLKDLCQAWIAAADADTISKHAQRYAAELAAYAGWLETAAIFWEGDYLEDDVVATCLVDVRAGARELARGIRQQMVVPPAARDASALQRLNVTRTGLTRSVALCSDGGGLSPRSLVELRFIDELLGSYVIGIAGLMAGDPQQLEQAMDNEQSITARLMQCRKEYATDPSTVSAACAP